MPQTLFTDICQFTQAAQPLVSLIWGKILFILLESSVYFSGLYQPDLMCIYILQYIETAISNSQVQ